MKSFEEFLKDQDPTVLEALATKSDEVMNFGKPKGEKKKKSDKKEKAPECKDKEECKPEEKKPEEKKGKFNPFKKKKDSE